MVEDSSLTGGGDCLSHWHSSDRQATHDLRKGLEGMAYVLEVSVSTQLDGKEDIISVDTSSGATVTVTLPRAIQRREVEILKPNNPGTVLIAPLGTDTLMGSTATRSVSSGGSAIHLKALGTDWRII